VIPNGIDLALFDRAPAFDLRARLGIPADRPIVLCAGRLEARKGIDIALDVASSVSKDRDAAFVFVGADVPGDVSEALRRRDTSGGRGSTHFMGQLDLADVRACVCQSDVVQLPSRWENCPYGALEAMAAGRALVASAQGGMPELIRDGVNGLLASPGDWRSFAAAVARLLDNPAERAHLGARARATIAESFDDVSVGRRTVEVYRAAIAAHGRRPSSEQATRREIRTVGEGATNRPSLNPTDPFRRSVR
jgi:glycosyltransferase involved in cell wall biosynthesis